MLNKDAYIADLERQDVALREKLEQLYMEKEILENRIENNKKIIMGAWERKVLCPYAIKISFPTNRKGIYDNIELKFTTKIDMVDFFNSSYKLVCNDRNPHIIKIYRLGLRRLENSFYDGYVSLYDTPKLPPHDTQIEHVVQMMRTSKGKRTAYYSFHKDDEKKRKTMRELLNMVMLYILEKDAKLQKC